VVDALTRIHAALVPAGVLVDTQPVGSRIPVRVGGDPVGELDADEWLETIDAVDAQTETAIEAGLYELRGEEHYAVVQEFSSGREALEEAATWGGTRIPQALVERLNSTLSRVEIELEIRLRLYLRR
jgi:hypothetical protein